MARNKSKTTGGNTAQTRAGRGPSLLQKTVTPAEREAIKNANVDAHLRRARSLVSLANPADLRSRRDLSSIEPDLVAGVAVSGKAAAYRKEGERLKEHFTSVRLKNDETKMDELKCRPKSSAGNGSGRDFIPWSKKC